MGVVKNLMVRIGADVRGVVGGMKTAYSATRQATSQIKNVTADMKRSVKDSFSGSRMSIREYTKSLEASRNAEVENVGRLQEKLSQMQQSYDSLKRATEGLDLTKSLSAQIQKAEKDLNTYLARVAKAEKALNRELAFYEGKHSNGRVRFLQQDLEDIREEAAEAERELLKLKSLADSIGKENLEFASNAGLNKLFSNIQRTQRELDVLKIKAGDLGQTLKSLTLPNRIKSELKSIGAAALSAARAGVQELFSRLKSLGVDAVKGLATLPIRLLRIGKSASDSEGGVEKLLGSIRNIAIVSKTIDSVKNIFNSVFGELDSIIGEYISKNEELNATIEDMKMQLGQAFAPVINVVIAAMQRLMPVIQSIASVINAVFTTLFGKVKTTTAGIKSSTAAAKSSAEQLDTYSFDQINKVSDKSEASVGESSTGGLAEFGELPAWANSLLGWIDKLKAAFSAGDWKGLGKIIGDGVNSAVDSVNAVDLGTKAGRFADNLFTTLNSALSTINFANIGKKAGEFVTSGFQQVNWNTVGETIGRVITALPAITVGFIQSTDWGLVSQSLSRAMGSTLDTVGNWIRSVDWLRLGDSIWKFISGIDFGSIARGFFNFFGSALSAGISTIIGFIGGVVQDIKDFFAQRIEECGGNVALGFLKGIFDGLCNLGEWIYENIVNPFFTSLCSGFGIHSPSTIMAEHGGNVITGFLNGILETLGDIGSWIGDHIVTPFLNWITSLFGISDHSSTLKGLGKDLISGLLDGMAEAWASIETFLDMKVTSLVTQFTQGWTNIQQATTISWKDIGNAVVEQLKNMQVSAAQHLEILRQRLLQSWNSIHADSKTYTTQMVQGVKTDFLSMRTDTAKTFSDLRNDLQRTWASMVSSQSSNLALMASQFKKSHENMESTSNSSWQSIQNTFTKHTESVLATMGNFRSRLSEDWMYMNNEVKTAMSDMTMALSNGFSDMLINVQDSINAVIVGVTEMANSIVDSVVRAMESISGLESFADAHISNSIERSNIRASVSGSTSSNTQSGTSSNRYSGGDIVRLATGGTTTGPTRALIGEAGKEAVMPLERNTSWMDTLGERLATFVNGGNETPMVFKFYLGGKKISQYVIKDINSITQTTGVCPINV